MKNNSSIKAETKKGTAFRFLRRRAGFVKRGFSTTVCEVVRKTLH